MEDKIESQIHDDYTNLKYNLESNQIWTNNNSLLTASELRRAGSFLERKAIQNKECARSLRNNALFRIKHSDISIVDPTKNLPFLYFCCHTCTPKSKDSLISIVTKQHNANLTNVIMQPKLDILSKIFWHVPEIYKLKKYYYPNVTQAVLNDVRLNDIIFRIAKDSCRVKISSDEVAVLKIKKSVHSILRKMQSLLSNTLLKITTWMLYKLLPFFFQSVAIQTRHIKMMQKANETNLPIIFMPLHKSYLDYILISFFTVTNNIRTPLIAISDNLRIPLLGWLMSRLGAFFIKDRINPMTGRRNFVYNAILHAYIVECLQAGHDIEFFIEAKRTSTGKPRMPKSGILDIILDAYFDGTIEDALLVPISINYEKLIDCNFLREQLDRPRKMGTFYSSMKAIWTTLTSNKGIVKIEICQPFSLKERLNFFLSQLNKSIVSNVANKQVKTIASTSLLCATNAVEERRQVIDCIARHVIYDCSQATPIMSTNVVAFLLLNKFRDGCTLDSLIKAFDAMREELEATQCNVAFCGETVDIVIHAIEILGSGLIKQQQQKFMKSADGKTREEKTITAIKPVTTQPNIRELAYYSNTMLVHYLMKSIVITAYYASLKLQTTNEQSIFDNDITVSQNVLVENVLIICNIFKYEFIFYKPCQDFNQVINETIDILLTSGIIFKLEDGVLNEEIWSQRFSKQLDDSSDEEYYINNINNKTQLKLSLTPEHSKEIEFLRMLLRPLMDTYRISAFCLKKLISRCLTEKDLIEEIFYEIKINLNQGIINYGESLCLDTIKNTLELFKKNNVLECHSKENITIYYLNEDYNNDKAINEVYETMIIFK